MEHGLYFLAAGRISAKHYIRTKIRIIYLKAHTGLSQIYISSVFSWEGAYLSQYFCVNLFD